MNKKPVLAIFFVFVIILFIYGCTLPDVKEGPYIVTHVVDGDTLDLNNSWRIRLSGINTPEVGECYYQEAKDALTQLTLGKEVYIERDITNIDKYGRHLRYIYLDNLSVNKYLVEQAYAKVYDKYKDDTKRYREFKKAEEMPMNAKIGVWACQENLTCHYVASRTGKEYHPADCKWAKRILPKNRICFTTEEEAITAGFKAGANC